MGTLSQPITLISPTGDETTLHAIVFQVSAGGLVADNA